MAKAWSKTLTFMGVCTLLLLPLTAFAASPDKARAAAEVALERQKKALSSTEAMNYGFKGGEDLGAASLDRSLPVYRFDVNRLQAAATSLSEAMIDTGRVEFMVNSDGQSVTRLTVTKDGDDYRFFRFGGSGARLEKGLRALPDKAAVDARLVTLGAAEFLYVGTPGQELLVSIAPFKMGEIESTRVYRGDEVLPLLNESARIFMMSNGESQGLGLSTAPPQPGSTTPASVVWAGVLLLIVIMCVVYSVGHLRLMAEQRK